MAKSIINNRNRCYLCGSERNLERHHCIFGTASRKKAEQDGLWVYLCHTCHQAVHNQDIWEKKALQEIAQQHWISHNGKTADDFIRRYGRSYL